MIEVPGFDEDFDLNDGCEGVGLGKEDFMTRLMTLLPALLLAVASHGDEGTFEARKATMLRHIDERLSSLQQHRACVQAAGDQEALRQCRKASREQRKKFRETLREERGARKARPAGPGDEGPNGEKG